MSAGGSAARAAAAAAAAAAVVAAAWEAGVGVEAEAGEARTRPEEERGVRGRSVARSSQKSRCISSSVTSSRHASLSERHKTRAVRAAFLPPSKDL